MKPDIRAAARQIVLRHLAERTGPVPIVDDEHRKDRTQQRLEHSLYLQRMRKAERAAVQRQAEAKRLATDVIGRAMKTAAETKRRPG